MSKHKVRFSCFPKTKPSPQFVSQIVRVFDAHYDAIGTQLLSKSLTDNSVLAVLHNGLAATGFQLESGKTTAKLIDRPVFFG